MSLQDNSSDDQEDAFSSLPEEVIRHIVSFLSFKDAAAMGLVSKAWRSRWKSCRNVDLDKKIIYPKERTRTKWMSRGKELEYVNSANHIVDSHEGDSIDVLRISSALSPKYRGDIDRWILFAFKKQAQNLVMDLPEFEYKRGYLTDRYILPQWFSLKEAPFIKHLKLTYTCLGPFKLNYSNQLTSLTLDSMTISDSWVHDMLKNCIHLGRLAIIRCNSLTITKLVVPLHLRLHHLCLLSGLKYLRQLEFESGHDLSSLECSSNVIKPFSFEKFKMLKKLSLMNPSSSGLDTLDYVVTRLPQELPDLETLQISVGMHCHDHLRNTSQRKWTIFSKLRFLSLCDFELSSGPFTDYVAVLLRISPILHKMELRGSCTSLDQKEEIVKRKYEGDTETHRNLKVVRVYGYEHCQGTADLVVYLLEHGTNLKIMQINRRKQIYVGEDTWSNATQDSIGCASAEAISEWFRFHISSKATLSVV